MYCRRLILLIRMVLSSVPGRGQAPARLSENPSHRPGFARHQPRPLPRPLLCPLPVSQDPRNFIRLPLPALFPCPTSLTAEPLAIVFLSYNSLVSTGHRYLGGTPLCACAKYILSHFSPFSFGGTRFSVFPPDNPPVSLIPSLSLIVRSSKCVPMTSFLVFGAL